MMLNTFHNAEFSNNRFGNPNSALSLKYGHVKIPSGEYFDSATGGFTIMLWIKPLLVKDWMSILDFGTGSYADNIMIQFYTYNRLRYYIAQNKQSTDKIVGNSAINSNTWTHIAFSFSGSTYSQYINGVLDKSDTGTYKLFSHIIYLLSIVNIRILIKKSYYDFI